MLLENYSIDFFDILHLILNKYCLSGDLFERYSEIIILRNSEKNIELFSKEYKYR